MRMSHVTHQEEHPYRLEDSPPELLEAFITDLPLHDQPLQRFDWKSLTNAADEAAARQAIPLV